MANNKNDVTVKAVIMTLGMVYFMVSFICEDATWASAKTGDFFYYSKWAGLAVAVGMFLWFWNSQDRRKGV